MILKALIDYYERHGDILPPFKKEFKEIDFIICIDKDGNFLRFEDMRNEDRKSSSKFLVERHVSRTSAKVANFLYDNSSYVLGFDGKTDKKAQKDNAEKLACFKKVINDLYKADDQNKHIKALFKFYNELWDSNWLRMTSDNLWTEISKSAENGQLFFSLRFENEPNILASNDTLVNLYKDLYPTGFSEGRCLVSGAFARIVDVTSATPIRDSQRTAKLVSFQVNQGYDSYGKEQGSNAPIGEYSEFAYTTALNHLLSRDSSNSFVVGSKTYVYWVSSTKQNSEQVNEFLNLFFGNTPKDLSSDDCTKKMRNVFESIYTGKKPVESEDSFYILGLKPNVARIAVSYWAEIPLREFAGNILNHFDDLTVQCYNRQIRQAFGIRDILRAVTRDGDLKDISPNLSDSLVKSIFEGLPYPQTLYSAVIRRIRAEQKVGTNRASIIKATLNRLNTTNKLDCMLNKEFDNAAYQCGRLFAVIEKLQQDANNISTVKERYISAASTTPALVFPTILRLSLHHSQKLENPGKIVYYDKLKNEIMGRLNSEDGFPNTLPLKEQGYFFIGYHQQMEEFYKPKESNDSDENSVM